jgi:hypothetical protein
MRFINYKMDYLMSAPKEFGFGTQIRKSPYFDVAIRWGATDFSVYNHMYIPRDFGNPQQNLYKELSHETYQNVLWASVNMFC